MCSLGYWYAGRDGVLLRNPRGLATQASGFGTGLRRSSLKTSHRDVLLTLRPSQASSPFSAYITKRQDTRMGILLFGTLEGTRTPDLLVRRMARLPEYSAFVRIWRHCPDFLASILHLALFCAVLQISVVVKIVVKKR